MSFPRTVTLRLALLAVGFLCASCNDAGPGSGAWQPPRIVRIEGADGAYSVSPMYGTLFGGVLAKAKDEPMPTFHKGTTYVLARPGELITLMVGTPLPYAAGDGDRLTVEAGEDALMLAGKTVSIQLGAKDEEGWAWLAQASEADLKALRLVQVKGVAPEDDEAAGIPEDRKTALSRLAKANPRLAVLLEDQRTLGPALEMFDPAWLSIGQVDLTAEEQDRLAAEPHLGTLMMAGDQEGGLGFLSRLGGLRTLSLNEWGEASDDEPVPVLPTIPSLRTLIVLGPRITSLAPVGEQPHLEELVLVKSEALSDLSALAGMPRLRALTLAGCEGVKDLSALGSLANLAWLSLPPATTQQQFETVCKEHPGLVVLQAVDCENVTDLAPVRGLKSLQVLTVASPAPLDPLAEPMPLRLLGVALKEKEGEEKADEEKADAEERFLGTLVKVMETNPDMAVVTVSPLCLGSGWILLLVPLAAAAWWAARRRGREAGAG